MTTSLALPLMIAVLGVPPAPTVPDHAIQFTAQNDHGTATMTIAPEHLVHDVFGCAVYQAPAMSAFLAPDGENVIAVIESLRVEYTTDTKIRLEFAVYAGNAETQFTISSGHLLRAGSIGDRLLTRARINYTDANGEGGGITGGFRPEMLPVELFYSYRAYYNEPTPFAQSFASLLAPIPIIHFGFSDAAQGQTPYDGDPAVSFIAIDRFRSAYSFTLSGLDRAAGSSVYYIVHHGRCGQADVASVGGEDLFDGQLTADDVIGFLTGYFAGNTLMCDLVGPGGVDLTDGEVTPDDLVAFLSAFFAGCAQ